MESERQPSQPGIWLVSLGILCAAILLSGLVIPPMDVPPLLYSIAISGTVGLVIGAGFTRLLGRFWRGKSNFAGVAVAPATLAAILVVGERARSGALGLLEFMRDDMLGSLTADPTKPIPNVPNHPQQAGDLGVIQGFVTGMYNHQAATQSEYLARLDAIKWEGMLDPARVAQDVSFSESAGIIRSAREIVAEFRGRDTAYMDGLRAELEALSFSSNKVRADAVEGFERGQGRNRTVMAQMWALETKVVDLVEDLAVFMHDRRDRWSYDDGQLVFEDGVDVEAYNEKFAAIDDVVAEQDQLRASQFATANRMLDTVEQKLGRPKP